MSSMIPSFLLPAFMQPKGPSWEEQQAQKETEFKPWVECQKFASWIPINGADYPTFDLFPEVQPRKYCPHSKVADNCIAYSPKREFIYRNVTIPPRTPLRVYQKQGDKEVKVGFAFFDRAVVTPAIYGLKHGQKDDYEPSPWMSLTPMELISTRPGISRAKGHVIVAGLGLGWMLTQITQRPQVKKITLVERSADLVAWVMPRLKDKLNGHKVKIVIANAYEVLPKMSADVCLLDIFDSYGYNRWSGERLAHECKNIKSWWIWG